MFLMTNPNDNNFYPEPVRLQHSAGCWEKPAHRVDERIHNLRDISQLACVDMPPIGTGL